MATMICHILVISANLCKPSQMVCVPGSPSHLRAINPPRTATIPSASCSVGGVSSGIGLLFTNAVRAVLYGQHYLFFGDTFCGSFNMGCQQVLQGSFLVIKKSIRALGFGSTAVGLWDVCLGLGIAITPYGKKTLHQAGISQGARPHSSSAQSLGI